MKSRIFGFLDDISFKQKAMFVFLSFVLLVTVSTVYVCVTKNVSTGNILGKQNVKNIQIGLQFWNFIV